MSFVDVVKSRAWLIFRFLELHAVQLVTFDVMLSKIYFLNTQLSLKSLEEISRQSASQWLDLDFAASLPSAPKTENLIKIINFVVVLCSTTTINYFVVHMEF